MVSPGEVVLGRVRNGLDYRLWCDKQWLGLARIMSIGKSRLGSVCYVETRSGLCAGVRLGMAWHGKDYALSPGKICSGSVRHGSARYGF